MGGKKILVLSGPTASGKSALAVNIARRLGTEIISADSRQVYTGLPVTTAVPTEEERGGVPHHLMEFLPLDAYYSAARFEQDAVSLLTDVCGRTGTAVVCGGSMMYIDALCYGMDKLPEVEADLRDELTTLHREYGDDWLRLRLMALDPEYYSKVDLMNIKRVFHAVEISMCAGEPYSRLLGKRQPSHNFTIVKVVLRRERADLFDRINRRVRLMAQNGIIDEVSAVAHLRHLNSLNTVGVKEMLRYIDGDWSLDMALARMAKNTRVYAKKQMTWFSRDKDVLYVDVDSNAENEILKLMM